ncbi:ATP-binding protein [Streptomyces sp. WSLK1-3]|uniref:ATP-binding protein n=1 Tax=Streptomyces sp. WSLK1-3 TaxID=3375475 RepID=UPI00379BB5E8
MPTQILLPTEHPQNSDSPLRFPRTALLATPAEAARVPVARRFTRVVAARWGLSQETRDAAELIVGELAGNAARHGRSAMNLCLILAPAMLRITLDDFGTERNPSRESAADDPCEHGRGLAIINYLADWMHIQPGTSSHRVHVGLRLTPHRPTW